VEKSVTRLFLKTRVTARRLVWKPALVLKTIHRMRTSVQLEQRTPTARICMDAVSQRPDLSWPGQMLIGLAVTAVLVIPLYFFIDQPVISFFENCRLGRFRILPWLARLPEAFLILSPVVLLAGLLRRWFTPWNRAEKAALAAAVCTLSTAVAVLLLKFTFGRSTDGFHPFHFGADYWAFPSGHTAGTVAVMVVAQAALPRWRLCWWGISAIVAATLIVLTHHYVGDIVGGAFLGWVIGGTGVRAFRLESSSTIAEQRTSWMAARMHISTINSESTGESLTAAPR
jgi:membrane-associated phospholipid phosphatase